METKNKRIAIVTGANRGLGFETCRELAKKGLEVILTCRDPHKGEEAAAKLGREGLKVTFFPLDVTDPASVDKLYGHVKSKFGRLDVLVNNAGILVNTPTFEAKIDMLRDSLNTNTLGPFLMCQKFIPLMKQNGYGRVVNLSSGMGQLEDMNGGYPAYRISKTALNAVTRIFAQDAGATVLVNSVCPGWVKTDMGGSGAELSVEEGADTIVWAATLPDGGPTGGFFRERKKIAW